MENKNMIVLGGGAAACFVLGYLGLHFMGGGAIDDPNIEKRIENNEPINENQKVNIKNDVLEEIKKVTEKVAENVESGWGQFWKGAYEETITEDQTKIANDEEVSASDYN